jgi:uncharacterized membrane protein (DUF441 family)
MMKKNCAAAQLTRVIFSVRISPKKRGLPYKPVTPHVNECVVVHSGMNGTVFNAIPCP